MTALDQAPRVDGPSNATSSRPRRRLSREQTLRLIRILSVMLALTLWEVLGRNMNPLFLPPLSRVAGGMVDSIREGELLPAIRASLGTFALGFGGSAAIGIPLGMAMGRSRVVEHALDTMVYALYVVPTLAFVPLLVLWFGNGTVSRLVVVISVAVFPIIVNTYVGAKDIRPAQLDIGRAVAATRRKVFLSIVVPATLPFIMAGLRLAIGRALSGLLVAELFTAIGGLGGLLIIYSNQLRTDRAFAPVIVFMIMGIGFTAIFKVIESRVVPWKKTERAQRL